MNNLTLVIPAKNESESLPLVLKEIFDLKLGLQIKVCLEKKDIKTIYAIKNFDLEIFYQNKIGYGSALIEGINSVETDFFCIFNADGSFNPIELEAMYKKINTGNHEMIFASRYMKDSGSDDDTIITSIGNYIFSKIGQIFFKLPISDILYTFVMGKTKIFKKINFKKNDFGLCVELPIKCHQNKYNITEIKSWERPRIAGVKKVKAFKDGVIILGDMIKLFYKKDV
jgi:glycosyltransferase involved in cell wall biosynthesis